MKRISIYTSTTVSSKSISLICSDQKALFKNKSKNKAKLLMSFKKRSIKTINNYFSDKKNNTENEDISNEDEYNSSSKNNLNSIQKDKKDNYSKEKHKKISRLPYYLKNNEKLKLSYLNNNLKSQKLPKFSSDGIGDKLKKDIDFPNVSMISKKKKINYLSCRKFSFISSDNKKFKQKYIFLNDKNEYVSFGLYYDKDIIDKNKELDEELIENSSDLDIESDEEAKINGISICMLDLSYAFQKVTENIESISYVKKNKVKIVNNN